MWKLRIKKLAGVNIFIIILVNFMRLLFLNANWQDCLMSKMKQLA